MATANLRSMTEKIHWLHIDIPADFQDKFSEYLRHLVYQGAYQRVGNDLSQEYRAYVTGT